MTPAQTLGRAALVLAGGLLQTLLVVGLWPLRTRGQERRAVAEAFAALGRYAATAPHRAPSRTPSPSPRRRRRSTTPTRWRRTTSCRASARCSTSPSGPAWTSPRCPGPGPSSASRPVRRRRGRRPADGLGRAGPHRHRGRPVDPGPAVALALGDHPAKRPPASTEPLRGGTALEERLPPHVAAVSRGLRGQLRAAARLVGRLDADEDSLTHDRPAPPGQRPLPPGAWPVLTLRANLNLQLGVVPACDPAGGRAGGGRGAVHPAAAGARLLGRPAPRWWCCARTTGARCPAGRADPRHPGRVGGRDRDRRPAAPRTLDARRAGGRLRVPVRGHAPAPATRSSRRSSPATSCSSSR